MYRIILPIKLDGYRYGISFLKGVGYTANAELAKRLDVREGFAVDWVEEGENVALTDLQRQQLIEKRRLGEQTKLVSGHEPEPMVTSPETGLESVQDESVEVSPRRGRTRRQSAAQSVTGVDDNEE